MLDNRIETYICIDRYHQLTKTAETLNSDDSSWCNVHVPDAVEDRKTYHEECKPGSLPSNLCISASDW